MNISILGYGKMGNIVEKMARERGHNIIALIDKNNKNDINSDEFKKTHVAIEFTEPEAAVDNYISCFKQAVPVVTGTTGWLNKKEFVEVQCKKYDAAFLYASNFSLGVNILFELNKKLAEIMKPFNNYKPAITEKHHIHKKDKPSGTAESLADQIMSINDNYNEWKLSENFSEKNILPVKSIREGEIFGEHNIYYESEVDKIELCHKAKNRNGFALGAVLAAEFLKDKKGVYSMKDVLSI